MNILIASGGDVGSSIAKRLSSENHNITIIEKDKELIANLKSSLDALVIEGDTVNINVLKKGNIKKSSIFLAVTNDDNANILSCDIAKKLNPNIIAVAKLEHDSYYFGNNEIQPFDFGISRVVASNELVTSKIKSFIDDVETIEVINFYDANIELIGVRISTHSEFVNKTLEELAKKEEMIKNIKVVAIYRNEKIIIPNGKDKITEGDKIYVLGEKENVEELKEKYFRTKLTSKNYIINGGNDIGIQLAKYLKSNGKNVIIIERNEKKCKHLSDNLDDILIIHGSATDKGIIDEINFNNSCFISVTTDDEYDMISSVFAKRAGAKKTICVIRKLSLVSIVNKIREVDAVVSPHMLTIGEILHLTKKQNVVAVEFFSEIEAEALEVLVSNENKFLNKFLKDIKFPEGMIIGAIYRDNNVIIPNGDSKINFNDKIIVFVVEKSLEVVEKKFLNKFKWRKI